MKGLIRCLAVLLWFSPLAANAQEPPEPLKVPASATEAHGIVPEPDIITRAVLFADRQLGKGDLTNGIYLDYASMIPGAGWAAVGPGYRHWYGKDTFFIDGSASISVTRYKMAQARMELPKLLKSRFALGVQARWQDFPRVDYFGDGPESTLANKAIFGVTSTQLAAYGTLRPLRWLALSGQSAWLNPQSTRVSGNILVPLVDNRKFVMNEGAATIDLRDFEGHPTRGILLRAVAARYQDRTDGSHDFDRREAEAAGFVPIAGARVVLALHGWVVETAARHGATVPFYLQPSLGGVNSMRSYTDYRFHDNAMAVANAEVRVALMSHIDWALFGDAGNVAHRAEDLDLNKQSFGTGFRLHTRRETFAMFDVAHGTEGWALWFRLNDPLRLWRLTRRTTMVPFVP